MPGRKKDEVVIPVDYESAHRTLIQAMTTLHMSRIDEMPRIELYRDQLLALVSTELAPLYDNGEKIITGSMVNNYVKQGVIPAPTRKRYTRRHLAYLLIVCTLKRVLPIAQVAQLISMCREQEVELAFAYDTLVGYLEDGLRLRFGDREASAAPQLPPPPLVNGDGEPITGALASLLQAAITLVIDKVYLERMLVLQQLEPSPTPLGHERS